MIHILYLTCNVCLYTIGPGSVLGYTRAIYKWYKELRPSQYTYFDASIWKINIWLRSSLQDDWLFNYTINLYYKDLDKLIVLLTTYKSINSKGDLMSCWCLNNELIIIDEQTVNLEQRPIFNLYTVYCIRTENYQGILRKLTSYT